MGRQEGAINGEVTVAGRSQSEREEFCKCEGGHWSDAFDVFIRPEPGALSGPLIAPRDVLEVSAAPAHQRKTPNPLAWLGGGATLG